MDWLAARGGSAVEMEDYCHSFEHTVELQLIFLQHALGPGRAHSADTVRPVRATACIGGGAPEDDDGVRRFLDALGELREREGERLFWILGVDMAHMGARYHDQFAAVAGQGAMEKWRARRSSASRASNADDAAGFWDLVQENHDDLKWCGRRPSTLS